jgi:hypothetical protein
VTGFGPWVNHWVYQDFYSPVWPNIVASILVAAWVTFKLRAHRKLQEQLRDLHVRHHAEHMDALDPHTPGGVGAVMSVALDAKTAAESAHGAVQGLAPVTGAPKPPAAAGKTPMKRTASGRFMPRDKDGAR